MQPRLNRLAPVALTEADSAAAGAAAGAWKSFTDQVSEVFEPAKPAEDQKPSPETPSTSGEYFLWLRLWIIKSCFAPVLHVMSLSWLCL